MFHVKIIDINEEELLKHEWLQSIYLVLIIRKFKKRIITHFLRDNVGNFPVVQLILEEFNAL